MLREASGTSAIPFYLYPRIGGSATLRGFPLDRFYGRNMILTTLEYRWLLHPRIEAEIFHDSGQIFEHTNDLKFFDWHRNYGFGIRFRNATGTQFRFELATSAEGISVHIIFGDRPIRALGAGPVRYPLYRP
jgi:outer membrane protein insertion porin family